MPVLESIFLGMFVLGFLFTLVSAVMSGAFSHAFGEGSAFDAIHGSHPDVMGGDVGHAAGGGHAEVGWSGHELSTFSPLSPTTLSAFVTAAGGMGYVAMAWWQWGPWGAGALAVGSGVAFAGLLFVLLAYLFRVTQGSSVVALDSLVGVEGEVITPIASGAPGEVAFVRNGQRLVNAARAADAAVIPQFAKVVIKSVSTNYFIVEETRESWLARTREQERKAAH